MEMSIQLHTLITLSTDRGLVEFNEEEAGWVPEPHWTPRRRENSLLLLNIKPRFPGH
jgi:hypothetical protein